MRSQLLFVAVSLVLAGCGNETELIPFGADRAAEEESPDFPGPIPPASVTRTERGGGEPDGDERSTRDDPQPGEPEVDDGAGCTLTQGYWKNHEASWPVEALLLGGEEYGAAALDALLGMPVSEDASLILAHQLIAAMLNVASGAGTPPEVDGALDAAHQWMGANADADGRLPFGTDSGSDANGQATLIADTLAEFNEGAIGPGHCR